MSSPSPVQEVSVRAGRPEMSRLAWAFLISFLLHLGGYGGYEIGKRTGLWNRLQAPHWLQALRSLVAPKPKEPPKPESEPILSFLDVNPAVATPEAPKDAKFYSDKNSKAANQDTAEKDVPKITGQQTDIVRTEDVNRSPFDRLQPAMPQPQKEPEQVARPKAPPGDLAMVKPDVTLRPDNGNAEHTRPRTLKDALRQNRNQLAGEKMKQDGGVNRPHLVTSLDAKATPFGAYDAAFIAAVEQHWFDLLDNLSYDGYRHGRVLLQFRLRYDGEITDMKVLEDTVGLNLSLLCQKAVLDPKPYDRWPRDMRLLVDKDYREIQFAFYYN